MKRQEARSMLTLEEPPLRFATTADQDARLTDRELLIVARMIVGDSDRAIARHLAVSDTTLKQSLMTIMDTLGASTRLELVLLAIHHQLLDVPPHWPDVAPACRAAPPASHLRRRRGKVP